MVGVRGIWVKRGAVHPVVPKPFDLFICMYYLPIYINIFIIYIWYARYAHRVRTVGLIQVCRGARAVPVDMTGVTN